MLPRNRGVVVNVSSIGGRVPIPFAAAYTASKYGVAGFTEALRDELAARSGIAVCGVYPGYVDTPTDIHSANHTGRWYRAAYSAIDRSHCQYTNSERLEPTYLKSTSDGLDDPITIQLGATLWEMRE